MEELIEWAQDILGLKNKKYAVGAGLIARYRNHFAFAIQPQKRWVKTERGFQAGLIGIGGTVESGETVLQSIFRECIEEVGVEAELQDSSVTYLVKDNLIETVAAIPKPPRPMLVVLLERKGGSDLLYTIVFGFTAKFSKSMLPRDLGGLVLIKESSLDWIGVEGKTIREVKKVGRILSVSPIPEDLLLVPRGTLLAYLTIRAVQRAGG